MYGTWKTCDVVIIADTLSYELLQFQEFFKYSRVGYHNTQNPIVARANLDELLTTPQ